MVEVRLLGEVGARTDTGDPVDVGPAKCQLVLAALATEPGAAVPVSRLVELVWGDAPPRTAERTLQSYIARIRRGLGADSIVRTGAAYRLDLPPECVDVARFEAAVDAGEVDAALAHWRGVPLAGLDAPGLAPWVDRMVERWIEATEVDLTTRAEADPASVVGRLTELTAAHPYRESLWALLMTALYRADRQADALAAYRRARRVLVDELGIEPGPRLRDLEALVLDQDADLAAAPSPPATPGPAAAPSPERIGWLPRGAPRLVGREREVERVRAALDRGRLVTLTGPGGVGKTTLAVAVGRAVADHRSVQFVDLSVASADRDAARAVVEAFGADDSTDRDLLASAAAAVAAGGEVLVIMDNCEQVVDGAATVAVALLDRCPEASVLVTSREPLALSDERVVPVQPLDGGRALELLRDRADAAGAPPAADDAAVEELCRRLDGLPLAIELAAARLRSVSPRQLLDRLDAGIGELGGRNRSRPDRHRNLRTTVAWSLDLLTDDERETFERLSVFPSAFELRAAVAVASDERRSIDQVVDLVDRLVGQSMVLVDEAPGGMRFRLLTPMRELGAERLAARGDAAEIRGRHAQWCLTEVREAGELLHGWDESRAVDRIQQLWPDLRTAVAGALAAGDPRLARDLVEPVACESFLRSRSEIGDWAEQILELADGDEDLVVFGLMWAARRDLRHRDAANFTRLLKRFGAPDHPLVTHAAALVVEDHEDLVSRCEEAAGVLHDRGDHYLAHIHEIGVGRALLSLGRLEESDEVMEPLVDRFRSEGPPSFLHLSLAILGYSKLRQQDRAGAERLFDESAAVEVPAHTHSRSGPANAVRATSEGDRGKAFALLRDHAAALLRRRDLYEAPLLCIDVVNLLVASGHAADAATLLGYLDTTDLFDNPASASLVGDAADVVHRTVADADERRSAGRRLDDTAALDLMQARCAALADGGSTG